MLASLVLKGLLSAPPASCAGQQFHIADDNCLAPLSCSNLTLDNYFIETSTGSRGKEQQLD